MSKNLFTTRKVALPVVSGSDQMVAEGVLALEALPDLLLSIGDDAAVSEIQIWENTPITASIFFDLEHVTYGWNFDRWVRVGY
jgi:hypothetical protein